VIEPVFLITGASSGIGAATARLAAASGFRVALVARRSQRLAAIAAELGEDDRAIALACDVTEWLQIHRAVTTVAARWGRLDVVFANAGIAMETSFLGTHGAPPDQWRDMTLANVHGVAMTARAAMPALVRGGGHLVLTGSAAGRTVRPGSVYSATKWAITGLAQAIRAECVGTGVRVTLIQPGLVDTASVDPARTEPKLAPEDVARAVLYAVREPAHVDVNEILIRPVGQDPHR
jgi:NADP-dependent 3-hydroxy acid dehydrogenase YdfG